MFEQTSEVFEMVRSSFFTYFIVAFSVILSMSPCLAAKEFSAYRLQQFQLHGTDYGSSGYLINLETRVLPGQIVTSPRRCYLVKLADLTVGTYLELLRHSVAGILVIVPSDFSDLSTELKEQIQELEQTMLEESTTVPVYFTVANEEILNVYETVKQSGDSLGPKSSALQIVFQNVHGNGVQLVSSTSAPKLMNDAQIVSIQGALIGGRSSRSFPILVSAHYDSMSPAAELSIGGDSNGSGSVALLEIARLFSHLYNSRSSVNAAAGSVGKGMGRPQNSLLFLLSGAGHFNYQGTQKYLEDQVDSTDHGDLQDTRLAVCLESLTASPNKLYIHLARSIREGTMLHTFISNLKAIASQQTPELEVSISQKKIKTENLLSWEHEKFHLKKINAVTLSGSENPSLIKASILDSKQNVNIEDLAMKTHVISEALAASLYNFSGTAFSGSLAVSENSITSLLDYMTSQPRSAQLLATKQNKFVQSLRSVLSRYTHETSTFTLKPDKRDANVLFYDSTSGTITAYDVKPAVFDLVLSIFIGAYLTVVYLAIKNFPKVYNMFSSPTSVTSNNGLNGHGVPKPKVH